MMEHRRYRAPRFVFEERDPDFGIGWPFDAEDLLAWRLSQHAGRSVAQDEPAVERNASVVIATNAKSNRFEPLIRFAEAIRTGGEPFLNVYRGVRMSIVGILAYRSALEGGAPVDVPDFRSSEEREKYEDDDWSPSPELARPGQPASSILGQIEPSEEARELARSIWSRGGGG